MRSRITALRFEGTLVMTTHTSLASLDRKACYGWLLVGFAFGGFFDGIVLHQILQWHHLLSGLDDPVGTNLRFQIMMDGLFHLAMYVVAVFGAVLLVAARAAGGEGGTRSEILRLVLIGFGTWHVLDAAVSHWLIGLHRIKMDSEFPLVWDIAWLAVFGLLPLLIAFASPPKGGRSHKTAAAVMTVLISTGIAAGAGPRFSEGGETLVVFRQDMEPQRMMQAVLEAGATLKWSDSSDTVWAITGVSLLGLTKLYAGGALLVSTTPMAGGCLAWTRRT
jgi:uncharacterized membrane protein